MSNIATQFNDIFAINACPHCNSTKLSRHGFDRGTQRYRCKYCHKTFKATIGRPTHGIHKKEKITSYLKALQTGLSVRKAAKQVGISKNTSFQWRHRFLSSLETKTIINHQAEIASANIFQCAYSAKGRKKQAEPDTKPIQTLLIEKSGQLLLFKLPPQKRIMNIAQILLNNPSSQFITKPDRQLTSAINRISNIFQLKKNLPNKKITKLQLCISNIEKWMSRFRGVASKYLQNYWNWHLTLINLSPIEDTDNIFIHKCLINKSLSQYKYLKEQ